MCVRVFASTVIHTWANYTGIFVMATIMVATISMSATQEVSFISHAVNIIHPYDTNTSTKVGVPEWNTSSCKQIIGNCKHLSSNIKGCLVSN